MKRLDRIHCQEVDVGNRIVPLNRKRTGMRATKQEWKRVLFGVLWYFKQVVSLITTTQSNCGVTALLLEINDKLNNGLQCNCCDNVIRGNYGEPTIISVPFLQQCVPTVAQVPTNATMCSHNDTGPCLVLRKNVTDMGGSMKCSWLTLQPRWHWHN